METEPGKPFSFDRVYALVRPSVPIDEHDPKWVNQGLFVMLMLDEGLAKVRTELDPDGLIMKVWDGDVVALCADLNSANGRLDVETFFRSVVPALKGEPKITRHHTVHFIDKPHNVISVINLVTLRNLEQKSGRRLDPMRFRANFYVDGL